MSVRVSYSTQNSINQLVTMYLLKSPCEQLRTFICMHSTMVNRWEETNFENFEILV